MRGSRSGGLLAVMQVAIALCGGCMQSSRSSEPETSKIGMQSAAGAPSTPMRAPEAAPRSTAPAVHGTDPDADPAAPPPPVNRVGVASPSGSQPPPETPSMPAEPNDEPEAQRPAQVVCRHKAMLSGFRSDGTIGSVYIPAYWDGHAFIATDANGNIVIVSSVVGAIDLGGGVLSAQSADWGLFVAKYDAECRHVWSRLFTTPGARVEGGPIAIDAHGDILLGGSLIGDVDFGAGVLRAAPGKESGYIAKLRADGTAVFSTLFPGELSIVRAVAFDGDGNAVISGVGFADTVVGGAEIGAYGTFVAKFAPDGAFLWSRLLPSGIDGASVRASASGNLTVAGFTQHSFSWGDGSEPLNGQGWIFFMSQLDAQGTHRWSQRFATGDVSWGYRYAFDGADIAYATYGTLPDVEMKTERVLERIDANGARLSKVTWPGSQGSNAWDFAADSTGHVIELGTFQEPLVLGDQTFTPTSISDLYLVKRDAGGRTIWADRLGAAGNYNNSALGLVVDPDDHAIVAWYNAQRDALMPDELEIVKYAP